MCLSQMQALVLYLDEDVCGYQDVVQEVDHSVGGRDVSLGDFSVVQIHVVV